MSQELGYSCYLDGKNIKYARTDKRFFLFDNGAGIYACDKHKDYPFVNPIINISLKVDPATLIPILTHELERKGYEGVTKEVIARGVIVKDLGLLRIRMDCDDVKMEVRKPLHKSKCPKCGQPGSGPHPRWAKDHRFQYDYFAHYEGSKESKTKIRWCYVGRKK